MKFLLDILYEIYPINIASALDNRLNISNFSVPVACMAVDKLSGSIVDYATNNTINPIGHAEIILINRLVEINKSNSNRLNLKQISLENYDFFVTLQPCEMCSHAMYLSKINRVIFGAYREFFTEDILSKGKFIKSIGGICEVDCSRFLKNFFNFIRKN